MAGTYFGTAIKVPKAPRTRKVTPPRHGPFDITNPVGPLVPWAQGYKKPMTDRDRHGSGRGGRGGGDTAALMALLRLQTPAQMEAQARRMADEQLEAQKKFLLATSDKSKEDALRRMQAVAAAGRAAASMNAGLFGMVGGEYNAGAQEIRGLATGLSGAQAGAISGQVAANNAGLAAVGAPAMAVGGPAGTPGIAGDAQAGVEAYRSGELAGQQLGTAGEAATFGLAGMVGAQNLRATQEGIADYRTTLRDLDENQRLQLMELASKRPELVAGFLDKANERNMNAYKIRQSIQAAESDARQAQAALDFKYAELRADATTAAQKLKLDKWYKQQSVAIDDYRASIYQQNANTSAFSADTSRINARTSQRNAQTSRDRADAYIRSLGDEAGVGTGKGAKKWKVTVANTTAKLPARLKGTDAAFNWVWSRVLNSIPKGERKNARAWLMRQLAAIAQGAQDEVDTGAVLGGTGEP